MVSEAKVNLKCLLFTLLGIGKGNVVVPEWNEGCKCLCNKILQMQGLLNFPNI
jgi:hypothetical protein